MKITDHGLARHAGHYLDGKGGHDLEWWDIESPKLPTYYDGVALGMPKDAEYHSGFLKDGVQHWHFTAKRPLSEGTCKMCNTLAKGAHK